MFSRLRSLINAWSKNELRLFYGALAIFIISVAFLSYRIYLRLTIEVPENGGEYIEGLIGQPTIINPVLATGSDIDRDLSNLLFGGLLTLAENYKTSEDGRTWTVTLKHGLLWSDGEPLTSDDVVYTLEAIQDPGTRSPLLPTWQGVVAERLSEREIKFTIRTPYAFFADNLRELKIIPRHIFGNIPNSNLRLSNYNLEPIGSGPYAFSRFQKRKDGFITEYELVPNSHYAGEPAHITKFLVDFFASSDEAINQFNNLNLSGFGGLSRQDLPKIRVGYTDYTVALPRYYALFFNQGTHLALKDLSVRSALTLATNREAIITGALNGEATTVLGPILPGIEGYASTTYENDKFSIEDAQKTLDSTKWVLGDDGIREKVIGRNKIRLEFELVVPQIPFLITAGNIIRDDWAKIGVKVTVVPTNPAEISDSAIKTRNYHIILFGNILKNNPDVFAFWHSSERFYPGFNLAVYENKKVDGLLESIRRDAKPETRDINLAKLQDIIHADHPAVFLFSPTYLYIATKNLKGFDIKNLTTPSDRFTNVAAWYLKTKRVLR